MGMATVKRLAADILGVGIRRIRIRADGLGRAQEVLTRQDVRGLLEDKLVYALPAIGQRATVRRRRRRGGRIRGASQRDRKKRWMEKVRSQRKFLVELLTGGKLDKKFKRPIYRKVKSGMFRSKAAMYGYLEENRMLHVSKEEGESK